MYLTLFFFVISLIAVLGVSITNDSKFVNSKKIMFIGMLILSSLEIGKTICQ
jgi:hypothetical protein